MGTLSNDDGDGDVNENFKKAAGLGCPPPPPQKKTNLHVQITLFCTLPCRHKASRLRRKIPRFVEDVNSRQRLSFSFPELRYSLLEFKSRKKLPAFDELNEMEQSR